MFGKLNPLAHLNLQRSACVLSCRLIRTRWERGYLKDLYHRRALIGADPVISRSAQPN
uniref:Uncharacterized protein n=1 Tax=Acrobeloides nanus TaxID=290746 RepID=A0A914DHG3_9BILA